MARRYRNDFLCDRCAFFNSLAMRSLDSLVGDADVDGDDDVK